MKKLIFVLAAALALTLLCSCAKPVPEEPVQADPEPEAPAAVHVTTFTADILSPGSDTLTVCPTDEDPAFGTADTVTVALADGLVPTGADGWPISVSELTQDLQVDITYLGDVAESDPPQVLAVAIRGAVCTVGRGGAGIPLALVGLVGNGAIGFYQQKAACAHQNKHGNAENQGDQGMHAAVLFA